jgi:shikimate dehydrogenase
MSSRIVCIIGHPVSHSRSPLIHKYWLSLYGIAGDYVIEDVLPANIETFIGSFGKSRYVGGNVTVPYKEIAFRKVTHADTVAKALGAVNMLWIDKEKLCGSNTDVYGFLTQLDQSQPHWTARVKTALIIGAGGVARAVIHGLIERKIQNIIVVNRTLARAEDLAKHFEKRAVPAEFADLSRHLPNADLLVNATALGMKDQPSLDIDLAPLKQGAVIYDLVYVPLETKLLADARARGFATVDGLGMLLHQAAPAFERWFAVCPEVTPKLRELVAADLEKDAAR